MSATHDRYLRRVLVGPHPKPEFRRPLRMMLFFAMMAPSAITTEREDVARFPFPALRPREPVIECGSPYSAIFAAAFGAFVDDPPAFLLVHRAHHSGEQARNTPASVTRGSIRA